MSKAFTNIAKFLDNTSAHEKVPNVIECGAFLINCLYFRIVASLINEIYAARVTYNEEIMEKMFNMTAV